MKRPGFTLLLVCALMLTLVVGGVSAQEATKTVVTGLHMVGGDIPTIDPHAAETSASIEIINQIFIGLTNQDATTANMEMGIAESMDVSEDGKVFTFKLRQDIPWVRYNPETGAVEQVTDEAGNVRYVNAYDSVYGALRGLAPETASPYSYVPLPYIVGAAEFNSGEGSAEDVMFKALDDYTVQITSPDAASFAASIYGLWVLRAVPQWAIEAGGDSWTEVEYINTFGPYALKEWAHDESITLIKNPFWPGTDAIPQAKIDEVVFRFLDPQQQFAEYLAGTMDAIQVPLEEIERVKADATLSQEYIVGNQPCTYYIGFDNTEAPMDNAHLRLALSYAIDRQSLVDNVTRGGQIPAQWFSRPGLASAPTLETHPDLGVKFNLERAQAELAMALEDLGLASVSELPALSLAYNDSSNHGQIMQAIQQMWTENLGITVTLTAMEPSTYFASISEDAPIIYRAGWCQDYSDANNFLYDVLYSKSSQNDAGWNNADYDALVEQARLESDPEIRRDLYAQAEDILVNQGGGIAPIYWYTINFLVKPNVEYPPSVTGNEAYFEWDITG
ncbi:MAG: peptide ABC transporter substrate-binding protein [Chloroflexi bacterium]|nr:peptide ABC transporter substrate-binding protein [Chloroflexota bacterium]